MTQPMYAQGATAATWRDQYKILKEAKGEYERYAGIMSGYEQTIIARDIKARMEQHRSAITAGALSDYNAVLSRYQGAEAATQRAKKAEIARWGDAAKLVSEMQAAEMLLKQAMETTDNAIVGPGKTSTSAALEALYQEARDSGDIYKQRAAAEVFKAAVTEARKYGRDAVVINRIAVQAAQDLEQLRFTDEMRAAEEGKAQAWQEYLTARRDLVEIGTFVDGYSPEDTFAQGPFALAVKRVQRDEAGNVSILSPDDPEISQHR